MNFRAAHSAPARYRRLALALLLVLLVFGDLSESFGVEPAASVGATGEETPVIKAPAGSKGIPLKRPKSAIGSLLFVQGAPGTAGQFITISGVAEPVPANGPGELAFDRFLGPLTMKGLDSIMKGVLALHGGWPQGQRVTLTFSEKVAPAELGPANLPGALLLDSMIRDWDIEPGYAVVGLLQADGSIDAVGAIGGRLDGAARARVTRLAVPEKNQTQVADYLLSAGITAFLGTQVFTVRHYNDAGRLALTKLDPQTAEAFQLYGSVQRTLATVGPARAVELLREPRVQGTLQKVIAAAPSHLSARILLDWGTGQKIQISLAGSMDAIDRMGTTLLRGFRANNQEAIKLPRERITQEVALLAALRARIDSQARPYLDSLLRFGDALQKAQGSGGSKAVQEALDSTREAANQEWVKVVRLRQAPAPAKE